MSVHEFYRLKELITLEQVNTIEWSKKKIRIFFSKTAMVGCCKLSLNANVSRDEHSVEIFVYLYTRIACDRRRISGRRKHAYY